MFKTPSFSFCLTLKVPLLHVEDGTLLPALTKLVIMKPLVHQVSMAGFLFASLEVPAGSYELAPFPLVPDLYQISTLDIAELITVVF